LVEIKRKMASVYKIPFNKPTIIGKELFYISQAIQNGSSAGDAGFTQKCHTLLESILNVPKVLLTTSCTHALEMSARLLDIQQGDEVIVPSFTFVSTANAFILCWANIRFIDILPDTLNLDENQLEDLITPRTKAVAAMHYAGVGWTLRKGII
jgi:dTDP-4-amino-4,6-dideoxygalactose transaminase